MQGSFRYQQTVVFEKGGYLSIDVRSDRDRSMSPQALQAVVELASLCAQFEAGRAARQAKERAVREARRLEAPICWPGFRP